MAMGPPAVGPNPPLVTTPMSWSCVSRKRAPSRTGLRPSGRRPTRWRGGPSRSWARTVAAPGLDAPGQAGLDRGGAQVEVVAVEAQPGLQAQRVTRRQAGQGHLGLLQ